MNALFNWKLKVLCCSELYVYFEYVFSCIVLFDVDKFDIDTGSKIIVL